ncbi:MULTISPECIES: ABC transporter permease subunit [Pseudoalteromonas]|jgi:phosphate transport system permease protein|uniref:ABC transporter permease subunit n=1 Tax=Pseudoalteromonas lipolytica TaxID=570156 RepID=A0ABU8SPI9_9GAMM|nr:MULTISPECIES: ABC transporter permease subunit [unclassified Pseudoalteromonas]MAH27959.1 phosphate ABC transporter permease [Pseudoalteromonadaceae bacterium]MBC7007327.1 ABC transporter permease subunit [Pseudoalteromonas sp. BZK2]NHH89209.1 Phosphate transport system permease protein PstC 1 [Pseudoalteromonas sp. MB47]TMP20497.1 phosphate ABC transporter permease [Pseudoalteromonas sp. S2721]TMP48641.1 phosphate ABC transporter permease [Pseudoalteromonas sp. S1650]|tara:strand:+ start:523 stop:2757 length:2235 start_codon:yes stop_codon:yes gene_type:complete
MTSNPNKPTFHTDRSRLFKDRFAKWGISAGGVMVLVALLLIFFYLLYVVQPIFESAKVETRNSVKLQNASEVVGLGIEEQTEVAFLLGEKGNVDFYNVEKEQFGKKITTLNTELPSDVSSFASSAPFQGQYAYGLENGSVVVVAPKFLVTFPNNQRQLTPRLDYPLGDMALEVDDQGAAITKFAFSHYEDKTAVVALTADKRVLFSSFVGEENMFTGEVEWVVERTELDIEGRVDELLISPDTTRTFVRSANQIYVYDTRYPSEVEQIQLLAANEENANLVSTQLLAGANSLMLANDNGEVSQWFEVNTENGREFQKIRAFETSKQSKLNIFTEFYRRTFFTAGANGELGIYYTTSDAKLWQGKVSDGPIQNFAISPRSNAALILADDALKVIEIHNEHPEVTWSALWQEVWYEGYPEPGYIWQSTSASDDFESKFSLVPISFGTIKAAMYAMLFAVPIALSAAIYTAYFMSSELRKVVKPTVEIMEALPTVILGFLAGLWLAPLIEEHLPAIVGLLVLLPIGILLTAFGWNKLPASIRHRIPEGSHSILLIPVVIFIGWLSFAMSNSIELWMFDGNVRQYLTNELGMTFDQRNSLVVGIAMGFAVIPTIFSIAEDAVFSVPKHLSNGSLALGATQWQTLVRVVLLTASPGIFSAVMMGLGRAVGETMIVLMATGNTPIMDWSIFQGMRTLAANIAVEMPESEVGSSHYRILFLAAFVLFIFTFVFNTVAEFVRQQLREKYSSM